MNFPLKFLITFIANSALVLVMTIFLSDYVFLTGGLEGVLMVGAVLTILNATLRPILNLLTLPIKFIMYFAAVLISNAVFLWITREILLQVDPNIVVFEILGGMWGWIVVSLLLGAGNWILKHVMK
jgi:putative membrane protein